VLAIFLIGLLAAHGHDVDSLPETWDGHGLFRAPQVNRIATGDSTPPQARDTALGLKNLFSIEVLPNKILTWLFYPIDAISRPAFRIVSRPLRPLIVYSDTSGIIDRTNELIHWGNPEQRRMFYPLATYTGNTSSRAGLRYRDALGNKLNYDAAVRWAPVGEWGVWLSGGLPDIPSPDDYFSLAYSYYQSPGSPVWIPGAANMSATATPAGSVATSVHDLTIAMSTGMGDGWSSSTFLKPQWRREGLPIRISDHIVRSKWPWLQEGDRGTSGNTLSLCFGANAGFSNVDYAGVPTTGKQFQAEINQKLTAHGSGIVTGSMSGTSYYLIGSEKYVYRRTDLEPYINLDPETIVKVMDPTTLWQRLTERRILAFHWTITQAWVNGSEPTPWSQFPSLGGDSPARAYDGRITDLDVLGATLEYRWPIWKYIDGSMFAEFAHSSRTPWDFSYDQFAPGWGFGLRVRTESSFFMRLQLARGRLGNTYIITTSPEF
jgi:hypothetical protein